MDQNIKVFLLQHVHIHSDGEESVKTIGVYSTQENAQQAIERLRLEPGFRSASEGFSIDSYLLDEDNWAEGYITTGARR
jgi:hypothetical protein